MFLTLSLSALWNQGVSGTFPLQDVGFVSQGAKARTVGKRVTMRDPGNPEQQDNRSEQQKPSRVPFDTSELNNIPRTTDEDPPYQNWWVVNDHDNR